jgi:hypothetical protein
MKKIYTLSLSILTISLSLAQASDPFLGTGSLNANGWVTHSGATPGQQTIAAGSLTYSGITSQGNKTQIIAGNTEDVNLASLAPLTGNAYYSALINLPNDTGLALNTDATGSYFLMMGTTAGATVTNFYGRIYIKAGTTAGTFNLGILNSPGGGTATPSYSSTDYAVGTTYFLVVKYDRTANAATLFVNPVIGGTEGAATITATNATGTTVLGATTNLLSLAIRQAGNATAGTGNIDIDEVRMGDSWAYVTSGVLRNNQSSISGLRVYPNPVSNGTLFIETSANAEKTVTVFDVLGKQVLNISTSNNTINVASLHTGVYIVNITEEGKTASRKLVIK